MYFLYLWKSFKETVTFSIYLFTPVLIQRMAKSFVFFSLMLVQLIACNYKNKSVSHSLNSMIADSATVSSLLDSASYFINKPGSEKTDLDSATILIRTADSINTKVIHNAFLTGKTFFNYSILYKANNNSDSGKFYIEKAIGVLEKFKDHAQLGAAYMELSQYYSIYADQQLNERLEATGKALDQLRLTSLKEKQADALMELGDLNQFQGNAGLALLQLNESLKLYNEVGKKSLQGLYDLLCSVSNDMGDPAKGIKYGILAVKTAEQERDTTLQLCTIYNRLAVAYSSWSRKGEAVIYLKKALAIAQKYHDKDAIETVLLNICFMPHDEKDYKELVNLIKSSDKSARNQKLDDSVYFFSCYNIAYTAGEKYIEASFYANELTRMISHYRWDDAMLGPIYSSLTRFYLSKKDYRSAEKYASAYILFSRKNNYKNSLSVAYQFRSKADSGLGNFPAALRDFKHFKITGDSIMDESKSRQIVQLQVSYETEKKDQDLKLQKQNIELLTNESKLEIANLKKTKNTRDIIAFSSILLLVLAYMGYRVKQRHNKKLELQKLEIDNQNTQLKKLIGEKEWLVKEIHHRVKNNLQIMTSLMNIQSNYLEKGVALDAIKASQSRMNAMSLIHQKLYQSSSLVSINMLKYTSELCTYLMDGFGEDKKISVKIDVEDVEFDISQAVPIGLILNEAVTNSMKYAFENNEDSCIKISLKCLSDDKWILGIEDNGKGLPPGFHFKKSNSIGITLMETLTEQLGGILHFKNESGLKISITFIKSLPGKSPETPER